MIKLDALGDLQEPIQPLLKVIKAHCIANNETIAVAESVTAGCLQLLLSTAEGAQEFFQGGITVYNCTQKAIHLDIEPLFAEKCNGVDASIALKMAQNVCRLFRAQIGIGITGYATKAPQDGIDALYAYVAIVRNNTALYEGKIEPSTEGIAAQWEYSEQVIRILSDTLKD